MGDILKMKGKLKNMRDNIVDEYVTHTMASRIMNSVQYFSIKSIFIIFHNLS